MIDFFPNTTFCTGYKVPKAKAKISTIIKRIFQLLFVLYIFDFLKEYANNPQINYIVSGVIVYELFMYIYLRKHEKVKYDLEGNLSEKKYTFYKRYISSLFLLSILSIIGFLAVTSGYIEKYKMDFDPQILLGLVIVFIFFKNSKKSFSKS